jgi:hypothetical protein
VSIQTAAGLDFGFLTEDNVDRELCLLYWAVNENGSWQYPVATIGERFGVPVSQVAGLVAERCRAFFSDEACDVCGDRRGVASRAEYVTRRGSRRWAVAPARSTCRRCQEAARLAVQRAAEELQQSRVAAIREQLADRRAEFWWIPPSLLSFENAVFLLSLFRAGASEDLNYVVPHAAFALPLSPTPKFDRRILDQLYHDRILAIHPGSTPDSVAGSDAGPFTSFFPFKVHWLLAVPEAGPSPARYLEDLEAVMTSPDDWPDDWREDSRELHRAVAFEECLEYLRLSLEEHGFDSQPGEKLSLVIRSALRNFSIGQVYNFIWRAARDAAAFYVREQTSKSHARNIVPGNIQRAAERALAEKWVVKPYRRDRRAPESQVSHVLFTMALRLADGGFNTVPPRPVDPEPSEAPGEDPDES